MGKDTKFTLPEKQAIMEDFKVYMDLPLLWDELSEAINGDGYIPEPIYESLQKASNNLVYAINSQSAKYRAELAKPVHCQEDIEAKEQRIRWMLQTYNVIKRGLSIDPADPEDMMVMLYFNRVRLKPLVGDRLSKTRAEYMYSAIKGICVNIINTSGKKGVDPKTNMQLQETKNFRNAMKQAGYSEIDDLVQEVYIRYILKVGEQVKDGSKFRTKAYMKPVVRNILIDLIMKTSKRDVMRKASGSDVLENIYKDDENS